MRQGGGSLGALQDVWAAGLVGMALRGSVMSLKDREVIERIYDV
jgi:hypothetical protein